MDRTALSYRPLLRGLRGALRAMSAAGEVARQRARLLELDDHLLDDIGITRSEALRESMRPIWDAPDHWRG